MLKKLKSLIGPKPIEKKRKRKVTLVSRSDEINEPSEADIKLGKQLFWGRYPYYPEMSSVYRKLFQKYEIDNSKRIKLYDALCGTDMCAVAAGSGPKVDYLCNPQNLQLVENNIKKHELGNKIEKMSPNMGKVEYLAHIYSFYPKLNHESEINWQELDEQTLPGGYVFVPKLVASSVKNKIKPSQKLADNIAFYFYIDLDHTAHWITVLENKIKALQESAPPGLKGANKFVLGIFKDEVTKWARELKNLKSQNYKVITSIYKHDDVP